VEILLQLIVGLLSFANGANDNFQCVATLGGALPVSTTHVTTGGIFGIGLLRKSETNWPRVQQILLSWVVTLPAGVLLAGGTFLMLGRLL
jgi:PiT family inorganic phosphate transporter